MLLSVYESAIALSQMFKSNIPDTNPLDQALNQIGLFAPEVVKVQGYESGSYINYPTGRFLGIGMSQDWQTIKNAKFTFDIKYKLIDDKKKALTNISNKTKDFSDSNATILNNAYEVALQAYRYRLNLELSVLESQIKSIDMEISKIKLMTSDEFKTTYSL